MSKTKNKILEILYWILSWTWGILLTLPGAIATLIFLIAKKKPQKFGWEVYTTIGKDWGGLEAGPFFFVCSGSTDYVKCHEHGHGFQNVIFGPLALFVSFIPSASRYWLRKMNTQQKKYLYAGLLWGIVLVLLSAPFACGLAFGILGLWIPFVVLMVYDIGMAIWMLAFEIPKYKVSLPSYYSVWFEAQASDWGLAFMSKFFPKED